MRGSDLEMYGGLVDKPAVPSTNSYTSLDFVDEDAIMLSDYRDIDLQKVK